MELSADRDFGIVGGQGLWNCRLTEISELLADRAYGIVGRQRFRNCWRTGLMEFSAEDHFPGNPEFLNVEKMLIRSHQCKRCKIQYKVLREITVN